MNYWDAEARWLDGPLVAEWLTPLAPPDVSREARKTKSDAWIGSLWRRLDDWRKGSFCDIYTLDRYLCLLNIRPEEIPDECWTAEKPVYRKAA